MMQAATFGNFPAARILAERLLQVNNPVVQRKVSRFLQDFKAGLQQIRTIPHAGYRQRCALLWRDDFLRRLQIDPHIDKYVSNVICTFSRAALAPIASNAPTT